jgi:hypothetical protein
MEGPFSATGVSKDVLCLVDSTIATSESNLRWGQGNTTSMFPCYIT